MAENFKDLIVWQKSKNLTVVVYKLCKELPKEEVYGLRSQIQRSSVSVPSNIAEGYRRNSNKEFAHFLYIATGSCAELETQLILVNEIFEIDTSKLQSDCIELQKMLSGLIKRVNTRSNS
jgi:four helix bundle protein